MALVAVEDGEGEVADVGRDAKAKSQHQRGGTEQREAKPDRIAKELQRFAYRAGEKMLSTEGTLYRISTRSLRRLQHGLCCGDWRRFRGLFEIGNERVFECRGAARLDQAGGGIRRENASRIHQ